MVGRLLCVAGAGLLFLAAGAEGACVVPKPVNASFPKYWGDWWTDGAKKDVWRGFWDSTVYQDSPGSCRIESYKRGRGAADWWDWNYMEQPPLADLPCVRDTMVWSVWVKANRTWSPVSGRRVFIVQVIGHDKNYGNPPSPYYKEFTTVAAPTTEWQRFSVQWFRTHESIVNIYCQVAWADTGTFWFDNATITRKGEATGVRQSLLPASRGSGGTGAPALAVLGSGLKRFDIGGRLMALHVPQRAAVCHKVAWPGLTMPAYRD